MDFKMSDASKQSGYVLVVDDDDDARLLLKLLLDAMNIPVRVGKDGVEALDHVKAAVPTLILLDLMMPRMDGFQVLRYLISDARTRHIPVIVVSAIGAHEAHNLKLPGVKHVMQKGRIADLQRYIQDILSPSPTPDGPRSRLS